MATARNMNNHRTGIHVLACANTRHKERMEPNHQHVPHDCSGSILTVAVAEPANSAARCCMEGMLPHHSLLQAASSACV